MNTPATQPAPEDVRAAAARLVEDLGEPKALARIGVSRQALNRLLAARPVRLATVNSVRLAILTSDQPKGDQQ